MFRSPFLMSLLLAALILTGCAADTPAAQENTTATAVAEVAREPQARAWLIGDGARLVAQLDPTAALAELARPEGAAPITGTTTLISGTSINEAQAPMPTAHPIVLPANGSAPPTPVPTAAPASVVPAPASAEAQAAWAKPVSAWMDLGMEAIARAELTPNRAARDLAILSVALNDSYVVLDAARAQNIEVSEEAMLAAAARQILNTSHPSDATIWQQAYDVAMWMGAWNHHDSAQAVANGIQLGKIVADAIQDRVRGDGATAPQIFDWPESIIPPGQPTPAPPVDRWRPVLPDQPIDPLWGKVHLIGLSGADGLTAAAPPNWDAVAFANTRTAFANTQHALTDEQRQLVRKWAAASETQTLAGLWFAQARALLSGARLDNRATAQVYAALGVTLHNAFVVSWADAYRYLVPRPTNWMHASDPAWSPAVPALSAPSYPSDSAAASVAAADVLAAFFPAQAAQLAAAADEAARSQVYAGVHWQIDTDAGADQGRRVGQAMLTLIR